VLGGASVDTSMGMTPAGGIVMGTRSGDLDPGTLVWLMREKQLDADALEDLVERRSGLAGISGLGSDMRALHAAADSDADARLAIAMFCGSAAKQIAAMCTVLGGIDRLVFTGGIGENDEAVRNAICDRLACIGLTRRQVQVLRSQEDEQIARHTWALLKAQSGGPASPPAQ
jgi:acetate kinase